MSLLSRASRLVLFAWTAMLAGCPAGPTAMRANRTLYNEAVQETSNEQLLLNIVRLRYREPMSFLEVSAINTNYKFDASGTLSATDPLHEHPRLGGIAGGSRFGSLTGTYGEDPTFSYVPVQGEQFAKRVIGDIDVNTLAMLLRGGWHVDLFLRIAVERIGELANDPLAVPAKGETVSSYDKFRRLGRLWRDLQNRGDLALSFRPEDEEVVLDHIHADQVTPTAVLAAQHDGYRFLRQADGSYQMLKSGPLVVFVEARYADANEATEAEGLLGGSIPRDDAGGGRWVSRVRLRRFGGLQPASAPTSDVPVQVRSFVNVLFYLAQGVQVPEDHVKSGVVKTYLDASGKRVDRRSSTSDLLNVRCSLVPPLTAFVGIFYRGCWFYIDDADVNSKDTFALLGYIYAVQAGEVNANAPVLTLPVASP
jgi:hypothetical protein